MNASRFIVILLTFIGMMPELNEVQANPVPGQSAVGTLKPSPFRIRVRISERVSEVRVRGFDLSIFEGVKNRSIASEPRASEWMLKCSGPWVYAQNRNSGAVLGKIASPATIQTPAGFLSYQGRPYHDEVRIFSRGNRCEVINVVDLEKYLDGLVNAEFSASWDGDAVAAQVVAARTYAYFKILEAQKSPTLHFDIDATIKDQVYDGSMKEDYRSSRNVEKTRGMILMSGEGPSAKPIKAFYHASCGGLTALPQEVWGHRVDGFRRRVPCPFCKGTPGYSWNIHLNSSEMSQLIFSGAVQDGPPKSWPFRWRHELSKARLIEVRVQGLDRTGRVSSVTTIWSGSSFIGLGNPKTFTLEIPAATFRRWIGSKRVLSTHFQISVLRNSKGNRLWIFSGRGYGHGVGMCQWGAKVMGDRGFSLPAILSYYYPDASVRKLW